jgi:phosphoribosylaminoimidazole (AIR) synthetase
MKPMTYKDAGVDIDAGTELVDRIKPSFRARTVSARS